MNAKIRKDRRAALLAALDRRTEEGDAWLFELRRACADLSASLVDSAEVIRLRVTALELAIMGIAKENDLGFYGDALTQLTQDVLVALEELEAQVDFRQAPVDDGSEGR